MPDMLAHMNHTFRRVDYRSRNARQQENYNFQKVSAVLADYGFTTIRLSDDWHGADFIALHCDGATVLKVQLKGRATISTKYEGKGLYVAFPVGPDWYVYPHDEWRAAVLSTTSVGASRSWLEDGEYHWSSLSPHLLGLLAPYRLQGETGGLDTAGDPTVRKPGDARS